MVYTSDNFKNLENIQSFRSPLFRLHRSGGACGILWKLVSLACQRSPRRGLQGILARKKMWSCIQIELKSSNIIKHCWNLKHNMFNVQTNVDIDMLTEKWCTSFMDFSSRPNKCLWPQTCQQALVKNLCCQIMPNYQISSNVSNVCDSQMSHFHRCLTLFNIDSCIVDSYCFIIFQVIIRGPYDMGGCGDLEVGTAGSHYGESRIFPSENKKCRWNMK